MADSNDLKIRVGAETKDFEQGMERVQKQIATLSRAQGVLSKNFIEGKVSSEQYTKGMSKLQSTQDRYVKSIQSAAKYTKGYGNAMSANAIPATQEFSRIIQDAPYGIQGVANNIQQLTSQFGYLSAKTGGAKQALKAMVGSLAGPAGILLAVSIVTAALPALIEAFSKSKSALDDTKFAVDSLTSAYDRYLQKSKDAQILIDEQTKMQVALAKARGASEDEINKITAQGVAARISEVGNEMQKRSKLIETYLIEYNKLFAKRDEESLTLAQEYGLEIDKLNRKNEESRINIQRLGNTIVLTELESALRKKEDAHQKSVDKIKKINEGLFRDLPSFGGMGAGTFDNRGGDSFSGMFSGLFDLETPQFVKDAAQATADAVTEGGIKLSNAITESEKFAAAAAQTLSQTMSSAFEGIGNAIGDALSGQAEAISGAGNRILNAFGGFLGELGKMAIAYGSFQLAIAIAGKNLDPISAGVVIAAGIGLVAVGKAIKNMTQKAPAAASGNYSGGSSKFSGSSSSSVSTNSGGGTYVFEIEGSKLVGVLRNQLSRNKALGGSSLVIG